jgi:hypothetical protein
MTHLYTSHLITYTIGEHTMRTMNEIKSEYTRIQKKLDRMKVRENFGQKELRAYEDFIGYIGDYDMATRVYAIRFLDDMRTYCYTKSY